MPEELGNTRLGSASSERQNSIGKTAPSHQPPDAHPFSHRMEYLLFKGIQVIIQVLPLKSVQRLGAGLGSICYRLVGGRRRVALDNLRYAFPEKDEGQLRQIALGAFKNYATVLLEFLWVPVLANRDIGEIIPPRGMELLNSAAASGKGVIVVTGHFANWEITGISAAKAYGGAASIVVQTQNNRLVDAEINAVRTMLGNKVVPMGISVREIIRALANKELVALAADQSGVQEGPFVEFFGRSVATHQGPAVFSLRTGAPMVLVLAPRNPDGSYTLVAEEIRTQDLSGATEENIRTLTQRHVAALERYIRRYPDQWLWLHRRWKHLDPASHSSDGR